MTYFKRRMNELVLLTCQVDSQKNITSTKSHSWNIKDNTRILKRS